MTDNAHPASAALERPNLRRSRSSKISPHEVRTDGTGGIVNVPPHRISCFGDPEHYYWGLSDKPYIRRTADGEFEENPWGCALCPARQACAKVVLERVTSDPELDTLLASWDKDTQRLSSPAKYQHTSWTAFVLACRQRIWFDCNKLHWARRKARDAADKKAQRTRDRNQAKRKARRVPQAVSDRLAKDRDSLLDTLRALRKGPKPPAWIHKSQPCRLNLISDVWHACEMLEAARRRVTARAVVEFLAETQRLPMPVPKGFLTRVNEIRHRLASLIEDGLWTPPSAKPPGRSAGSSKGFHSSAVFEELDDEGSDNQTSIVQTPSRSDCILTA